MALSLVGSAETSGGSGGSASSGSQSKSCTAGNGLLVCIRWYGAITVSSVTCAGETVDLVGSAYGNGTANQTARSQWAYINNIQSTGSKTVSVTLSGSASNLTISLHEISGQETTGMIGAHAPVATGTATANPSTSITTTAANSAVFGCLMSSASGATSGSGYTTLAFTSFWSFEFGEYTTGMDAGAAGSKTVDWTQAASDWHIDAVEVLPAGSGSARDQEGFRFGEDDGSESAHTWAAAQDTNISRSLGTAALIRALVNATGDPASAAYTLRYQKNGAGGYVALPVGAGNAETYAQPTWGAAGTAASGTTSCTPEYPTGVSASTSKIFCVVTGRSNTADTAPTMPAGWTRIGGLEGGTGTWGVDTGTRRVDFFVKDTVTGSETGTVTVSLSGTTANTLRATIFRIEVPSEYSIDTALVSGADSSNGTGYSAAASSSATFDANRLVLIGTAQNIDTGTVSAAAITATGITFGTLTNRATTAVTNGNDHRHILHSVPVSSGSGTVAPTFSYTISASGSGPTGFLVLRARLPAVVNEIYVAASSNIAAGGEATTARLTAPSGKTTSDFVTGRRWDDENGTDTIDITVDDYTEVEWCLNTQSPATNGDYFEFRVYAGAAALQTYTVTPRLTLGSPPAFMPVRRRSSAHFAAANEPHPTARRRVRSPISFFTSGSTSPKTISLSAAIQIARELTLSVSTAVQAPRDAAVSVEAVVQTTNSATVSLGAAVQQALTSISNLQAAVQDTGTQSVGLDAAIQAALTAVASIDTVVADIRTNSASMQAAIQAATVLATQLSTSVALTTTQSASVQAAVQDVHSATSAIQAAVLETRTAAVSVQAAVQDGRSVSASMDTAVQDAKQAAASLQTAVLATVTAQTGISAQVQADAEQNSLISTAVQDSRSASSQVSLAIEQALTVAASIDAAILEARAIGASINSAVQETKTAQASIDAMVQGGQAQTTNLQTAVLQGKETTTGVDTVTQVQQSVGTSLDAQILASITRSASLSAFILSAFSITSQIEAAIREAKESSSAIDAGVQIARLGTLATQAAIQEVRAAFTGMSAQVQAQSTQSALISLALQQAFSAVLGLSTAVSEVFNANASLNAAVAETFNEAIQFSAAVEYARNAQIGFSIYVNDPTLAPVQEREVYVEPENREIAIEEDIREIDVPSEEREIRIPTEEEMKSAPWIPPVFHIHSGATLDYLWKWGDWLAAIGDAIETFEVIPGEGLVVASQTQEASNVRGFLQADPTLTKRKNTIAHCKIVTVGLAGVKRTDIRDIIVHIRPCGLPV